MTDLTRTRKCPYCSEEIEESSYEIHQVVEAIWALEKVFRSFLAEYRLVHHKKREI